MKCQVQRPESGAARGTSPADPKWQQQAAKIRSSLEPTRRNAVPWSSSARLLGVPRTARTLELLDVGYLCAEQALRQQGLPADKGHVVQNLTIDVSQNICRKPWSSSLRTFTTTSQVYLYSADRILLPEEALRLLGFDDVPGDALNGVSAAEVSDLVGQAMALPSVAVPMLALLQAAFEHGGLPDLFAEYESAAGTQDPDVSEA